jgi:hypothetical protein
MLVFLKRHLKSAEKKKVGDVVKQGRYKYFSRQYLIEKTRASKRAIDNSVYGHRNYFKKHPELMFTPEGTSLKLIREDAVIKAVPEKYHPILEQILSDAGVSKKTLKGFEKAKEQKEISDAVEQKGTSEEYVSPRKDRKDYSKPEIKSKKQKKDKRGKKGRRDSSKWYSAIGAMREIQRQTGLDDRDIQSFLDKAKAAENSRYKTRPHGILPDAVEYHGGAVRKIIKEIKSSNKK